MWDYKRTHHCNQLTEKNLKQEASLAGWVHRRRDHGGLIFIDLRDKEGLTQLVIDPTEDKTIHEKAEILRSEWVIAIRGTVVKRAEVNPKLHTGSIEIKVAKLEILSPAKTPPFPIADETQAGEDVRLRYRYLDMRKGIISKNLRTRHKIMLTTRQFLDALDFCEIQTPILAKSTPEGARDYLVPSRIYPGSFYALPQSPQIFKQLFMIGGMERYFQIAPCFRDEDLRADRQPEFTQIDLEMSFENQDTLFEIVEGLLKDIFKNCLGEKIPTPFKKMPHTEVLERYGTDKPDLRFDLPLVRIDDLAKQTSFSIFQSQLEQGGCVKSLCVKGGAEFSRRQIDELTALVQPFGLNGLGWIKYVNGEFSSNLVKFFPENILNELKKRLLVEEGDLILFAAEQESIVNQSLDHLRRHIAQLQNLIEKNTFQFLWVVDFPMFKKDPDTQKIESESHPFTSPHPDDLHLLDSNPLSIRSLAYDLVVNGYEVASGSQRIFDPLTQKKVFEKLGLSKEDIYDRFGFFVEALQFGTPPHLGIALGLDRLNMILSNTDNIRDVIAFPKTQKASDLMMQSPARVSLEHLQELEIETKT